MHADSLGSSPSGARLPLGRRPISFLHDRVQEAAYSLIAEEARAAVHLRIGRLLAARTPPADLEEKIFEIVNQFNRAPDLVTSAEERDQVAELNLVAGKRAKASTAYASALAYLAAGRALLSGRRTGSVGTSSSSRSNSTPPSANCSPPTWQRPKIGSRHWHAGARGLEHIAAIARLRLTLYTTLDRSDRGVEVCLEFLRTRRHRLVTASDERRGAARIRADLVAAREPLDRGAHRPALDDATRRHLRLSMF